MTHAMIVAMAAGPLALAQPPAESRPSAPPTAPTDGPCFPDCNGDHVLNVMDFICFQSAFATPECGGDCNQDQACNVLDFVCFTQRFAAGCSAL